MTEFVALFNEQFVEVDEGVFQNIIVNNEADITTANIVTANIDVANVTTANIDTLNIDDLEIDNLTVNGTANLNLTKTDTIEEATATSGVLLNEMLFLDNAPDREMRFTSAGTKLSANTSTSDLSVVSAGETIIESTNGLFINDASKNLMSVNGTRMETKIDILPNANNTIDLGTSSLRYSDVFTNNININGITFGTNTGVLKASSGSVFASSIRNTDIVSTLPPDFLPAPSGFLLIADGAGDVDWGQITNSSIDDAAGIVDTKLATISTAGKVSNSATTATDANTASAIVSRDASGNFSAGIITATLNGTAAASVTSNIANSLQPNALTNNMVNSSAAIAYSKLNLTASVVAGDIDSEASSNGQVLTSDGVGLASWQSITAATDITLATTTDTSCYLTMAENASSTPQQLRYDGGLLYNSVAKELYHGGTIRRQSAATTADCGASAYPWRHIYGDDATINDTLILSKTSGSASDLNIQIGGSSTGMHYETANQKMVFSSGSNANVLEIWGTNPVAVFNANQRPSVNDTYVLGGVNTRYSDINTMTLNCRTSVIPESNNSASVGTNSKRWSDGYINTLLLGNGSVGSPALTFSSDTNTGLYRIAADNIGVSVGGTKIVDIDDEGISTDRIRATEQPGYITTTSSSQSIANSTASALTNWNTASYSKAGVSELGGVFTLSSSYPGLYQINFTGAFASNSTGYRRMIIREFGGSSTIYAQIINQAISSSGVAWHGHVSYLLQVGGSSISIQLAMEQDSGGALDANGQVEIIRIC